MAHAGSCNFSGMFLLAVVVRPLPTQVKLLRPVNFLQRQRLQWLQRLQKRQCLPQKLQRQRQWRQCLLQILKLQSQRLWKQCLLQILKLQSQRLWRQRRQRTFPSQRLCKQHLLRSLKLQCLRLQRCQLQRQWQRPQRSQKQHPKPAWKGREGEGIYPAKWLWQRFWPIRVGFYFPCIATTIQTNKCYFIFQPYRNHSCCHPWWS